MAEPTALRLSNTGRPPGAAPVVVGDLQVDPVARRVSRAGQSLELPKTSFDLLLALIGAAPSVLTLDELAERVWPGRVVSNENITQRVRLLRKALGDDAQEPRYIGLVRGQGYRLLVEPRAQHAVPGHGTQHRPGWRGRLLLIAVTLAGAGGVLWWQLQPGAPQAIAPPSIAVLPFVSLSDDRGQGYFADGLSEEIINELTRIPGLRVAARTASFAFKGTDPSLGEVAEALGVTLALEGSVRWDADQVRVTAQLISLDDGFHMWSETFTRGLDDVFSIQQDIARSVAGTLSLSLGAPAAADATETRDGQAYAHMLRGLALFWEHTPETTEQSIAEFLDAVARDPGYARAWVLLGHSYGARSRDPARTAEALASMADAARRALELAPEYWEAHALDAWVSLSALDFVAADAKMTRALDLRERFGQRRGAASCPVRCFHEQLGRFSTALEEARRMQTVDPLGPSGTDWGTLYQLGRREEALAAYERLRTVRGRTQAQRSFQTWMAMEDPDPAPMNAVLEQLDSPLAGSWGEPEVVLPYLRRWLDDPAPRARGFDAYLAMYASLHGDPALAVDFLRRGFLRPGYGAMFLLWHPALAEARATDAFADFVTELGLVEAWRRNGRWPDFCRPQGGRVSCDGIAPPPDLRPAGAARASP